MAKVHNQIFDGSEESYIDSDGEVHFTGELLRLAMTEDYPLPSTGDEGVVRKSPRVFRPTEQGYGSSKQAPIRECFQQCTDRWNNMLDTCDGPRSCLSESSKANIWAAKQNQGVMCSYFDLFMAACMSTCSTITIIGPDGVEMTFGTIPGADPNWPCTPSADDAQITIGHTSQQMEGGEEQALTAIDLATGLPSTWGSSELTLWSTVNDNGYEELPNGRESLYTSPDENPNCENNVTVFVVDECGNSANLEIATNTYPDGAALAAISCYDVVGSDPAMSCHADILCNGIYVCFPGVQCPDCISEGSPCNGCHYLLYLSCAQWGLSEGINDRRSDELKAGGCCPTQMF